MTAGVGCGVHLFRRTSAAHPLAYLLANGGGIYDGTLSAFFTDSGFLTPCTTPETDPVGGITNQNGAAYFQDGSPNKPDYVENNGIRGFRSGTDGASELFMKFPLAYGRTNSPNGFTFAVVRKHVSGTYLRYAGPPQGQPLVLLYSTDSAMFWYDTGNQPEFNGLTVVPIALEIFTLIPSGDDAGVYLCRYSLDGVTNLDSGALASMNLSERPTDIAAMDWAIGGNAYSGNSAMQEVYFGLVANVGATAADIAAIRAYAMSAFGALT